MKKVVSILVIVLLLASLIGCGSKSKKGSVKTQDLIDSIGEQIAKDKGLGSKEELSWNEVDLLSEEGAAMVEKMSLNPSILEEAIYYENPMNDSADRIIIAKVKEEKDVNTVKLAFDEFRKNQEKEWKQNLPEQYEKVKGGQVFVKDAYVFYYVYDDIASIKKISDDALVK
ncbi:DUF4358 domain-containing protein [Anaerosporobacter faecicola]|uniref:DUF4358 domain-containing protein n=1 Tax=Anaerosporobacter faecicola TaxID=2718714 RepID=UPI00143A3897|nr:DUF4358 domain-containing protein [Anaerosporobacter faecicola]